MHMPWSPFSQPASTVSYEYGLSSQPAIPLMTWPAPRVKEKGWPRSRLESNFEPSGRVPCTIGQSGLHASEAQESTYGVVHLQLVSVLGLAVAVLGAVLGIVSGKQRGSDGIQ